MGLYFTENRRRFGLALVAVGGLLLVWFSFILVMDAYSPMNIGYQISAYFVGLFFVGCLYGSQIFSALNRKREAIQYLMIPASNLEKLLSGLLFGVVLFFIVYTVLFYLVDIPMVHLAQQVTRKPRIPGAIPESPIRVFNLFDDSQAPDAVGIFILKIYFSVQAAFILGSIYFTRYAVLKTIIASLAVCLLATLFLTKGISHNLPDGWKMGDLFEWFRFDKDNQQQWVRLPFSVQEVLYALISYALPIIFWFITYFRLREKEV